MQGLLQKLERTPENTLLTYEGALKVLQITSAGSLQIDAAENSKTASLANFIDTALPSFRGDLGVLFELLETDLPEGDKTPEILTSPNRLSGFKTSVISVAENVRRFHKERVIDERDIERLFFIVAKLKNNPDQQLTEQEAETCIRLAVDPASLFQTVTSARETRTEFIVRQVL